MSPFLRKGPLLAVLFALLLPALADYEAPQIWTVNGVSLTYSRASIESRDRSDLVVTYEGAVPRRLRGSHFASRGQEVPRGATSAEVRSMLGPPSEESPATWLYRDPDRHAILAIAFWHDRVSGFTVSRDGVFLRAAVLYFPGGV